VRRFVFIALVALATFASCDPYGSETAPSPVPDGGTGDGGLPTDGASGATDATDAGARKPYVAALGGTIVGGIPQSAVYVAPILEDGSLGAWVTSSMPDDRTRAGAVAIGSSVFLVAGDSTDHLSATPLIASATSTGALPWRTGAPLGEGRVRHGVVAAGPFVYVLGGTRAVGEGVATVFVSRPLSDGSIGSWAPTTPLPSSRASFGAAANGAHLYVFGGEDTIDAAGASRSDGLVADVASNGTLSSWRALPDLGFRTVSNAGAATDEYVYEAGGFASISYRHVRGALVSPNGDLASWVVLAEMQVERALFALVAARGHLYAIGGIDGSGAHLSSVEMADIQPGGTISSWRHTTPLPVGLSEHAATSFEAPSP
jgi:hypothetical protein